MVAGVGLIDSSSAVKITLGERDYPHIAKHNKAKQRCTYADEYLPGKEMGCEWDEAFFRSFAPGTSSLSQAVFALSAPHGDRSSTGGGRKQLLS